MASSYKFCVIATGEYDIYAAKRELMSGITPLVTRLLKMLVQLLKLLMVNHSCMEKKTIETQVY